MIYYLIRRVLYALPILLGINILTFALFFMVNTPDDMARMHLGEKHIGLAEIEAWKEQHGYNLPLFYNGQEQGAKQLTQTLFVQKSMQLFVFNFGLSDAGRNIKQDIKQRMWPSLAIAFPALCLGILANIILAMLMAFFKASYLDLAGVLICIILMSISSMFYIIGGQFLFGKILKFVPISGYSSGWISIKFVLLPIIVEVISGLGSGSRWYRTLFLEEMHKDYVKTARAKGISEINILFHHVLKNTLLPILTSVVVLLPALFMGSLVLESFFAIPGLGSYMIDAIQHQDFAIVRVMVFLGSVLYIIGLILTDITYTMVDPRVRLS